jgi:hypothetical protein
MLSERHKNPPVYLVWATKQTPVGEYAFLAGVYSHPDGAQDCAAHVGGEVEKRVMNHIFGWMDTQGLYSPGSTHWQGLKLRVSGEGSNQ